MLESWHVVSWSFSTGSRVYATSTGVSLYVRYRNAYLRIHNDEERHAGGEQSSAVPNDA